MVDFRTMLLSMFVHFAVSDLAHDMRMYRQRVTALARHRFRNEAPWANCDVRNLGYAVT